MLVGLGFFFGDSAWGVGFANCLSAATASGLMIVYARSKKVLSTRSLAVSSVSLFLSLSVPASVAMVPPGSRAMAALPAAAVVAAICVACALTPDQFHRLAGSSRGYCRSLEDKG